MASLLLPAALMAQPAASGQYTYTGAPVNLTEHTFKCDHLLKLQGPRQGKERFIFGLPSGFESKFDRMGRYYTTILPEKGAGYYSTVNVKYNGQIVCRK